MNRKISQYLLLAFLVLFFQPLLSHAAPQPYLTLELVWVTPVPITSVAFSPDSMYLAMTGYMGETHIWDLESGLLHRKLQQEISYGYSVAFSPDSKLLAIGGQYTRFWIWDFMMGTKKLAVQTKPDATHYDPDVRSIAFTPDGKYVITQIEGVELWDVSDGKLVKAIKDKNVASGKQITFLNDGRTALFNDPGAGSTFLNIANGEILKREYLSEFKGSFLSLDQKTIVVGNREMFEKYNFQTGELLSRSIVPEEIRSDLHMVNPETNCVVIRNRDYVALYDLDTPGTLRELVRFPLHDGDDIYQIRFSPDGKYLVMVGSKQGPKAYVYRTADFMSSVSDPAIQRN